jgi:tetratricopeptide (TPR) repeat protein
MSLTSLQRGTEALRAGDAEGAVAHLSAAVREEPQNAAAWCALGAAMCSAGRAAAGVEALRRAIALDSSQAAFHFNLGRACELDGRAVDAALAYQRALDLRPDYPSAAEALNRVRGGTPKPPSGPASAPAAPAAAGFGPAAAPPPFPSAPSVAPATPAGGPPPVPTDFSRGFLDPPLSTQGGAAAGSAASFGAPPEWPTAPTPLPPTPPPAAAAAPEPTSPYGSGYLYEGPALGTYTEEELEPAPSRNPISRIAAYIEGALAGRESEDPDGLLDPAAAAGRLTAAQKVQRGVLALAAIAVVVVLLVLIRPPAGGALIGSWKAEDGYWWIFKANGECIVHLPQRGKEELGKWTAEGNHVRAGGIRYRFHVEDGGKKLTLTSILEDGRVFETHTCARQPEGSLVPTNLVAKPSMEETEEREREAALRARPTGAAGTKAGSRQGSSPAGGGPGGFRGGNAPRPSPAGTYPGGRAGLGAGTSSGGRPGVDTR